MLGTGRGRLVFIEGEAGVGKTALMRGFTDEHRRSARILWGACDALFTPSPLGPLLDVAEITGGELEELVEKGARPHEVVAALMRGLQRLPTIFVLEDLHWADEATLDVLRLLARRVEDVPVLMLASYRDNELERTHPLRIVLGELATQQSVGRLRIDPLSPAAVATLAEPHGVDSDELYRKTAGNPFFVTEVLAAGEVEIPHTVRDAVLARSARLTPAARALLEAVAIAPPEVDLWLLEALAGEAIDHLDECLDSGMLSSVPEGVAFRHELARLAVEESLPPNRRAALHRRAFAALAAPPSGALDLTRLAHHAEAAGDTNGVLRFAPAAAAQAASVGAHRQAAAQLARALRFGDGLSKQERAELLDLRSHECLIADQYDEAIEALELAIEYHREVGDRAREGASLRALSSTFWCPGRTAEAEQAGRDAVAVLEKIPAGRELAMAYSNLSALFKDMDDLEEALTWGNRALDLARRLGDTEVVVHALSTIGSMQFLAGSPEGKDMLERSLARAEQMGLEEHVARAYVLLVWVAVRQRLHGIATRYLALGLDYCSERGFEMWRLYLLGYRARLELDQGRWAEAVDSAALVLRIPRTSTVPRAYALVVLGLARVRRGDPGHIEPLDEAWILAKSTGELQRIGQVAAAKAEAAWLTGDDDAVAKATDAAFDLAQRRRDSWLIGELAFWRWKAGIEKEIPQGAAEPFALQISGKWDQAAELWTQIGSPYEAALALAEADDETALRRGLDELHALGARKAAATIARRLRDRGVRGLPRGPRTATGRNPANLTPREVEIVSLVARGLGNAEIGERLFISKKTVEHHVSAILRKLEVGTRGEASAKAVRLGLVSHEPLSP